MRLSTELAVRFPLEAGIFLKVYRVPLQTAIHRHPSSSHDWSTVEKDINRVMMPSSRCVDRSLFCVCVCVYHSVLTKTMFPPVHLRDLIRLSPFFSVHSIWIRGILKMKTQMVRAISGCFKCVQFAHGVSIFFPCNVSRFVQNLFIRRKFGNWWSVEWLFNINNLNPL